MRTHYDNLHITKTAGKKKSTPARAAATILYAACIFGSASALAGFYTGAELFPRLEGITRGDLESVESLAGLGYVQGVHDASEGRLICSPGSISARQMIYIVHGYMSKNPDLWNLSAATSVERALSSQWPCQKANPLDDLYLK